MILVTGGTGLLGAQLLFDLAVSGQKVRAIRRQTSDKTVFDEVFSGRNDLAKLVEWEDGDITGIHDMLEALNDIDEVYHCAARVSFHRSHFKEMMKTNVEGTANLVNLSLENGIKKFCFVSSIAALGRAEENKVMDERTVWKSSKYNSMYSVSKYGGEREVWRGMEEGLNAVIVNPSIIIGPGDWKNGSSAMFRQVWNGMKFYSEGVNGFVDVRDVTKCMIALMEKNIFGERFIISEDNYSYRAIFNWIADSFGKPRPTIKVNGTLSEIGWRAEFLRSIISNTLPFITRETARSSQRKWFYSNEKIKRVLGIEFIPIQQAIAHCAKVFLKQKAEVPVS